ncbi:helicase [Seminavis robusta]|uniref:Helicase n=1 Tax=Seminavis robusta TaxID=568900 RepID=A0A9N8HEJ3_9STRA|nr:helicase [Seminavis robusta]|eukprot:Sro307_g113190.1 helicase (354) ;mRNA; f:16557-17618
MAEASHSTGASKRSAWQQKVEALQKYKQEHNTCDVEWGHDSGLAVWVYRQRSNKQTLKPEIRQALDAIGFDWTKPVSRGDTNTKGRNDDRWVIMLSKLKVYKSQYGNCKVPPRFTQDRRLRLWVVRQRRKYRANTLAPEHRKLLEDIDFHRDIEEMINPWLAPVDDQTIAVRSRNGVDAPPWPQKHSDNIGIQLSSEQLSFEQQAMSEVLQLATPAPRADSEPNEEAEFDLDNLAVLVYDFCILLDRDDRYDSESQLCRCEEILTQTIESLGRARDPGPRVESRKLEDSFSRLVPLVEELGYLVDPTNIDDVVTVSECERVLSERLKAVQDEIDTKNVAELAKVQALLATLPA